MTCNNISLVRLRRMRAVEHLHRCGPHAIAELLADVERRIGGGPAITAALADFEHLNPATASRLPAMRAPAIRAGRFPARPLRLVSEATR